MFGCESWTIRKAERQRIDAFELWCWRRLLRVLWTAKRSNLKKISPENSLEGLMLKLKLQWHHRHNGHEFEKALGVGDGQGGLVCCSPWGRKESDTTEWLNWLNWTLLRLTPANSDGPQLTLAILSLLSSFIHNRLGDSWVLTSHHVYLIHHHTGVFFLLVGSWPPSGWLSGGKSDPGSLVYKANPQVSRPCFCKLRDSLTCYL